MSDALAGDPPELYNNPARLESELGWSAKVTDLEEIIDTAWQWKKMHPLGYRQLAAAGA